MTDAVFTDLHLNMIDRFVRVSGFGNGAVPEALSETEVRIGSWRIELLENETLGRPYRVLYDTPCGYAAAPLISEICRTASLPDALVAMATEEQQWRLDALIVGVQRQIRNIYEQELMEPEYRRLSSEMDL